MIRRASWKVVDEAFAKAMVMMKEDAIPTPNEQAKNALLLLYCKGVLADLPSNRKEEFNRLMNPTFSLGEKELAFYTAAHNRLLWTVPPLDESGDTTLPTTPPSVQRFDDFLQDFPVWNDPSKSFVCQEVRNFLIQRVQRSGLCYIHAPVALQHYLVARNGVTPTGMIDIAKYIRGNFDGDMLYQHIFNNRGGYAPDVLSHILEPESMWDFSQIKLVTKEQLEQFGPHLLTAFRAHTEFADTNNTKLSFSGMPNGEVVGKHAMIIVGVRDKEDGSKVFLLQNWWAKKQFVEVDQAYVEKCGGRPLFVITPQEEIPQHFDTNLEMYGETSLDLAEEYPMEGF